MLAGPFMFALSSMHAATNCSMPEAARVPLPLQQWPACSFKRVWNKPRASSIFPTIQWLRTCKVRAVILDLIVGVQ